jgi:tight adherence protein B
MFLLIAFLIFFGALLAAAWYALVVPHQAANEVLLGRMRELRASSGLRTRTAPDLIRHENRGRLAVIGDFVAWVGLVRRLQQRIDQANLGYRAAEVFAVIIGLFVFAWLAASAFVPILILRVLLAAVVAYAPVLYIEWKRSKRLRLLEEQLPDAIDLFNRSMKAGHNIHAGLETIAGETADPTRMEFRKIIEELALGSPLEAALHNLGRRVPLVDMRFFVIGLILQRQTGANMVEVLDNLSLLVRERLNLAAKMKAATAQQRFSAALLCGMPVVFAIGLWFLKPEYLVLLYTDETGSKFLTYGIVSEIIGIVAIRRIANPKF